MPAKKYIVKKIFSTNRFEFVIIGYILYQSHPTPSLSPSSSTLHT
jgi:hypothetical protein